MSWKRPPARPAKQIEGEIKPREPAPSIGLAQAIRNAPDVFRETPSSRVPATPSATEARGRKIRQSARGQDCTIRLPGACNFLSETVVLSHWPGLAGGRGMGLKSSDLASAYACSACHDVIDARRPLPLGETRESVLIAWLEGHLRTLVILEKSGIV